MPRANAPGGSGPRRVRRRPTTAGRSLVPPKQAARANRYSRNVVRTNAVKDYKRKGSSGLTPRQEAIALRTLARRAASKSEWKRIQDISPTDYAMPQLEASIKARRSGGGKEDNKQSWVESLLFGSEGLDTDALKKLNKAVEQIPGFGKGEFFGDKGGLEKFQNTRLGEQAMLITGGEAGAGAAGKGAKVIAQGKSAAGKAAKSKVATTAERVGQTRAGKALKTGTKRATTSKPAQAVKQTSGKVAAKTPKPVKVAAKGTARHVAKRKWAYATGPGAITAYGASQGNPDAVPKALVGIAKGTKEDPTGTAGATVRAVPAILKGTGEILANLGLTGYRALEAGGLGKDYSGKEILDPTVKMTEEQLKGLKDFYDTYASGDVNRIATATKNDYGLIPVTAVAPLGVKGLARPYRAVRGKARAKVAQERELGVRKYKVVGERQQGKRGQTDRRVKAGLEPDRPISNYARNRQLRKRGAINASQSTQAIRHEVASRESALIRASARASRSALTKTERKAAKAAGISPADMLNMTARKGLNLDDPVATRAILTRDLQRAERLASERDATLKTPNPKIVRNDAVTTAGILNFMLKGDRLERMLADKNFREAIKQYAKTGRPEDKGGLSYSRRAQYMSVALERDNPRPLPEEYVHPLAAKITGAKTRAEARADWELGKKSKLRQEATKRARKVKALSKRIVALENKNPRDPALKKLRSDLEVAVEARKEINQAVFYSKSKDAYTPAMEEAFVQDIQKIIEQEGRVTPLRTTRVPTYKGLKDGSSDPAVGANPLGRTGGEKRETGVLLREGNVDESFQELVNGSIRKPVARRWLFGMYRSSLETDAMRVDGKIAAITGNEVLQQLQQGTFNLRDYTLFPLQTGKRVFTNPTRKGFSGEPDPEALALEVNELQQAVQDAVQLSQSNPDIVPGRRYLVVARAGINELMKQSERLEGLARVGNITNLIQSKALLATSPAWLGMQFIAETLQAATATSATGIPTPVSIAQIWGLTPGRRGKMVRAARNLSQSDTEAGWRFLAATGEAPGVGNPITGFRSNLQAADVTNASAALGFMRQNKALEFLSRVPKLDTLGDIDRWKAGLIRRGVAASYVDKRLNSFTANLKDLFGLQDDIYRKLKGKSYEEQLRFFATDSKATRELQQYMTDVMGEWYALTSLERLPASLAMFYPFIRMSLRMTLWGFPKRHPVKAGILQVFGASNAEQLTDLLHGDPSFFARYAAPVVYGGEDGAPSTILDLSRAVPGANALVEGLMGDDPWSAVMGVTQPVVQSVSALITGKMPFTGEELPSDAAGRISKVLASLLALPAPFRAVDQLNIEGVPVISSVMNGGESDVSKYAQDATEMNPRRVLFPAYPRSVKAVRNESQLADIFDRLGRQPTDEEISQAQELIAQGRGNEAKRVLRNRRSGQKASDLLSRLLRESGFQEQEWSKRQSDFYSNVKYGKPKSKAESSGGGEDLWSKFFYNK